MGAKTRRRRILVVDDDPGIVELIRTALEPAGYAVLEARDGVEGFEKARAEKPDLMILDVLMPRMDGWEVLRRIRTDPRIARLPVLMLTCLSEDPEILRGLEAGATEYLSKPFYIEDLVASVRILLEVFDQPLREAHRQQLIARRRRLAGGDLAWTA